MGMLAGAGMMAGGLYGLSQGAPASSVNLPNMFQMPNMGSGAEAAFGGIGNLSNYNTWNIPQAGAITHNLVNNPYAPGYQAGANQAGALGQNQALGQYNVGQGLTGLGAGALPAWASSVIGTGFDPQGALYNRTLQQTQQQQGAANAQAGVGTTPYGAGLADQNLTNFNIDWQNQQLGRQLSALSGAGSAIGTGANVASTGQGLSASAVPQMAQSSAIPYSTFGQIGQGQIGALSQYGQFGQNASMLPQQQIQDYLSYIQQGTGANSVANQTAKLGLDQSNLAFNQNAAYANAAFGGLGNLGARGMGFGGMGGPSGGNTYPGGNPGNAPFFQSGWGY